MQNTHTFDVEGDHIHSMPIAQDRSGGSNIVAHVNEQTAAAEQKNELSQVLIHDTALHVQSYCEESFGHPTALCDTCMELPTDGQLILKMLANSQQHV